MKDVKKKGSKDNSMSIKTCYVIGIQCQLDAKENKKTNTLDVSGRHKVDDSLMRQTAEYCREAIKFCTSAILSEWDFLQSVPKKLWRSAVDKLIHTTAGNKARYPEFDKKFKTMPGYTRRMVIADALGMVRSYKENHAKWEALKPAERGAEPTLGIPPRYELTFYDQERRMSRLSKGQIGLKLYDGKKWDWYYFQISASDAAYLSRIGKSRKMLSPTVQKIRGRYEVRFCFEERKELVQNDRKLDYKILAVDLGINAAASWCVMTADGTVHAKGVIHLTCEEDRLNRMINRKRQYQQAGKKSSCVYRWVKEANRQLSIATAKALTSIASEQKVDCIVFEHLDGKGKIHGGRYRERIHMWRKNDVQARITGMAHRLGMRISRVCAWGTSKLAFDGSGQVDRHSVYHFEHGKKVYNYSLCRFQNGKIYNCDLSAAQNIGARFFLREYERAGAMGMFPGTPQRTLNTLIMFIKNGLPEKAV